MNRRHFISTATLGTAALALGSQAAQAGEENYQNVVFDAQNPGHWKAVESLHVPDTEVKDGKLHIHTPHPMSEAHYIVSHTVVLKDGKFLDRKTFNWKDRPASVHTLPEGYKELVKVTSTCNLHDFWVKEINV